MPLYAAQLLALDDTGGEVLNVTVAGDPKVSVTQAVSVSGLVAIPWAQGDRSGVAFRADAITSTTPAAAPNEQARPQNNPSAGARRPVRSRPNTGGLAIGQITLKGTCHGTKQQAHQQHWVGT
ncbi:hypothetical protein LAUMK41_05851 [Mycobacterium attenuatum]|nr:hypothetical protein LAUMK41_05851 [Mycobacterium attenuatum]